eukprot:scaffold34188_cov42-Phaeocystis_antarctica.AAC.1
MSRSSCLGLGSGLGLELGLGSRGSSCLLVRRLRVVPCVRPHPRAQGSLLATPPPLLRGVVPHALEQRLLRGRVRVGVGVG